jgi:hypothetical protein
LRTKMSLVFIAETTCAEHKDHKLSDYVHPYLEPTPFPICYRGETVIQVSGAGPLPQTYIPGKDLTRHAGWVSQSSLKNLWQILLQLEKAPCLATTQGISGSRISKSADSWYHDLGTCRIGNRHCHSIASAPL